MNDDKIHMFRNRLVKVFRHIGKQAKRQGISCYRVYDHDLPEFPFCIELYGELVCIAEYKRHHHMTDEEHEAWLDQCLVVISEVLNIPVRNIYIRQRRRKAGRQGQYEKRNNESEFFIIEESGLKFKINLTDYLDTGLFLDHRITRAMVKEESKGKNVLNLFCYTGSFSVYAAAGGALSIVSVDLSKTYLQWAEENLKLNHLFDPQKQQFIHADATRWLDELKPGFFDLVILDPPTFSNSKRMKDFLDIQLDHVELINKTLRTMKEGGVLYFSTNYKKFQLEADKIHAASIKDITRATTPFDFKGKLFRYCYKIIK